MSYQLMLQKAIELQQSGALHEAEQLYRQILQAVPDNADVLNLLGLIAQQKGLHPEAAEYFYKAAAIAPRHYPIYFNLAVSLGALEKYAEAEEAYKKVLQLKPDCSEAAYGLGKIYWAQNKIEAAKTNFAAALQINADNLDAVVDLAEISDDLPLLQKLSVTSPAALYYLGRRAFNAKDYAAAQQYLISADILLSDEHIKLLLAETYLAQNNPAEAQKIFYQAYNLNPRNWSVLLHIADLESESDNFAAAEQFYKKTLEYAPNNLQAHVNYANLLAQTRRIPAALEEYRQAVLLAPDTPEISYNLALILKDLREYEQALDLMFRAFYADTTQTAWSLNIAETLVLYAELEPKKARKICENWLEKMPENLVVRHLWAAMNNKPFADEAAYNQLLFDNFAATYEQTLQNVNYSVVDAIAAHCLPLSGNILDLGCGTGLVAQKLKTAQNRFTGIDISARMLEIAQQKKLYEQLIESDIIKYLSSPHPPFTTIIAADVFCYFGDLAPLLKLCPPARLVFSIESALQIDSYAVQNNGRYKHNPAYVQKLLQKAGYTSVKTYDITLRTENQINVSGVLFDCSI